MFFHRGEGDSYGVYGGRASLHRKAMPQTEDWNGAVFTLDTRGWNVFQADEGRGMFTCRYRGRRAHVNVLLIHPRRFLSALPETAEKRKASENTREDREWLVLPLDDEPEINTVTGASRRTALIDAKCMSVDPYRLTWR